VNVAPDAPARPALRYYGGKFKLAPWIISFFPEHQNYVEPCGGAASVLLQKPRSPLETYNDLDGNVVNFFRVLRDRPDELIRAIRLTPWAREEFEICCHSARDSLENARRFYLFHWGSITASATRTEKTNFATIRQAIHAKRACRPEILRPESNWENLEVLASRFFGVQIENIDAFTLIKRHDESEALFYLDPPYISYERAEPHRYTYEWTDTQHAAAAHLLHACQGFVVVSGYACPLYTELYEAHGWERHDKEAQTNSGGKRIESVWLSPRTVEALGRPRQGRLW
jgi:DNA adenine methylase